MWGWQLEKQSRSQCNVEIAWLNQFGVQQCIDEVSFLLPCVAAMAQEVQRGPAMRVQARGPLLQGRVEVALELWHVAVCQVFGDVDGECTAAGHLEQVMEDVHALFVSLFHAVASQ